MAKPFAIREPAASKRMSDASYVPATPATAKSRDVIIPFVDQCKAPTKSATIPWPAAKVGPKPFR